MRLPYLLYCIPSVAQLAPYRIKGMRTVCTMGDAGRVTLTDVAPAAMPLLAEAREGFSGLVCNICACQLKCQLDGDDDE